MLGLRVLLVAPTLLAVTFAFLAPATAIEHHAVDDNTSYGIDGSWMRVRILWDDMPTEDGFPMHNPDRTFYPGDKLRVRVEVNRTHHYSEVRVTGPVDVGDFHVGARDNVKKTLQISRGLLLTEPTIHDVTFTLFPAEATLRVYSWRITPDGEAVPEGAALWVDETQTSAPGKLRLEQGRHVLSYERKENCGALPADEVWVEPGEEYRLDIFYVENGESYTVHNCLAEGEYVCHPEIPVRIEVVTVPFNPRFSVLSYLRTVGGEEWSYHMPGVVLVKYLGNQAWGDDRLENHRVVLNRADVGGGVAAPMLDENGEPLLYENGQPVMRGYRLEFDPKHWNCFYLREHTDFGLKVVPENENERVHPRAKVWFGINRSFDERHEGLLNFRHPVLMYAGDHFRFEGTITPVFFDVTDSETDVYLNVYFKHGGTVDACFTAGFAWTELGYVQPVVATAWRLRPGVENAIENDPWLVMEENSWVPDTEVGFRYEFVPLVEVREAIENFLEGGTMGEAAVEYERIRPFLGENLGYPVEVLSLPVLDNWMVEQYLADTTVENEPTQAVGGVGWATTTLRRYGGDTFMLRYTYRVGGENAEGYRFVRVPFLPDENLPLDMNLRGGGFAAVVENDLPWELTVRVLCPRQAGKLKRMWLMDNENRVVREWVFFPEFEELMSLTEMSSVLLSSVREAFAPRPERVITIAKYEGFPTELRMKFQNEFGAVTYYDLGGVCPYESKEEYRFQTVTLILFLTTVACTIWAAVSYHLRIRRPAHP